MKPGIIIAVILLGLSAGCKHPTEVKVEPDTSIDPIVVSPISVPDTATYQGQLDSMAVSPDDQKRFGGFLLVTRATFDAGSTVVTKTWSTVVFGSRDSTVQDDGKTIGYYGISLGPSVDPAAAFLRVNGLLMVPVYHTVRVRAGVKVAGWQYYRDLSSIVTRFDTTFVWHAAVDMLGISDVSVDAPSHMTVQSPKGGAVIPHNQDLLLAWKASGMVSIILSHYNPLSQRSWPVMQLQPQGGQGRSVLPANVLRALSPGYYVITFLQANRKLGIPVMRYSHGVMAQASSVYNCYVELR